MTRKIRALMGFFTFALFASAAFATPTFVCQEPGGKRLIEINGNDIGPVDGKTALHIGAQGFIEDADGNRVFYVSDDDVRKSPTGLILATFDGEGIRHGKGGAVVLNYHEKEIRPDAGSNRIYSIEGPDTLSKQQLVAAMSLLKPEIFKLTDAEAAEQKKAIAEAEAEQDKINNTDQIPGEWMVLNSSGIQEKLGQGSIKVAPKKGGSYPVVFDYSKGDGPKWTGVGAAEPPMSGDQNFFIAYGTENKIGLCVYEVNAGALKGTWYLGGDAKTNGSETLDGPAGLDGDYKITAAAAPLTGAAYTGTVAIHPLPIVGAADSAKPYSIVWTIGGVKLYGIGILSDKRLYVAGGAGTDINIAKYVSHNGSMNADWFKAGSAEKGSAAATKMN